jgi:hypothetical protein
MKFIHKLTLAFAAAVFALAIAGCGNSLLPTDPGTSQLERTGSFIQNASSASSYFPVIGTSFNGSSLGSVNATTQKTLVLAFPNDRDLEFLKASHDGLEAELKKFLKFYNLIPVENLSSAASRFDTEIGYTVKGKAIVSGQTQIAIELTGLDANSSGTIALVINAAAYYYQGTNKVDFDGNGVTGEGGFPNAAGVFDENAGYDNYFSTYIVSGGKSAGAVNTAEGLGLTTPVYRICNPRREFTISYAWGFSPALDLSDAAASRYLELTYLSAQYGDTTDYSSQLEGLVTYQYYDRETRRYVDIAGTPAVKPKTAFTAVSNQVYNVDLPTGNLTNQAIIRAVYNKKSITTTGVYFGFKQRFYLDSEPTITKKTGIVGYVLGDVTDYLNTHNLGTIGGSGSSFIDAGSSYAYAESTGKNVILYLKLNVPILGTSGGPIGNLGLKDPPTEKGALNQAIKVQINDNDSDRYIPLEKAVLERSIGRAATNAPDVLKLTLDPSVNINDIFRLYVYIGDTLGYLGDDDTTPPVSAIPAGSLGNVFDITLRDGKIGYGQYIDGFGYIYNIQASVATNPAIPESGLEGFWVQNSWGIGLYLNSGEVSVYTASAYSQSVYLDPAEYDYVGSNVYKKKDGSEIYIYASAQGSNWYYAQSNTLLDTYPAKYTSSGSGSGTITFSGNSLGYSFWGGSATINGSSYTKFF